MLGQQRDPSLATRCYVGGGCKLLPGKPHFACAWIASWHSSVVPPDRPSALN